MLILYVQRSGSKVIVFATSAKFEIIALKTASCQGESEFWLAWPALAGQVSLSS